MFRVRKRNVSLRHFLLRPKNLCLKEKKTYNYYLRGYILDVFHPKIQTIDNLKQTSCPED